MKTRTYFENKLEEIKLELISEIMNVFHSKMKIGHYFCNCDDANTIKFVNKQTGLEKECIIDYIFNDETTLIIYPKSKKYYQIQLNKMMNIHELMHIHYISLNEIITK
jgi:hypothetical protein